MKFRIYSLWIVCLVAFTGCEKDDERLQVIPAAEGVFVDERDGVEYPWVQIGQLQWMTRNMRAETETGKYRAYSENGLPDYEQEMAEAKNYETYGYLYDHEAAVAVVPEGWRLPTDADWQELERELGTAASQLEMMGWRGNEAGRLMQENQEGIKLGLQTGGYIGFMNIPVPRYIGMYGFYWTATIDSAKAGEIAAIYRQVSYHTDQICRNSTLKVKYMSVRCVRDAVK